MEYIYTYLYIRIFGNWVNLIIQSGAFQGKHDVKQARHYIRLGFFFQFPGHLVELSVCACLDLICAFVEILTEMMFRLSVFWFGTKIRPRGPTLPGDQHRGPTQVQLVCFCHLLSYTTSKKIVYWCVNAVHLIIIDKFDTSDIQIHLIHS